MLTVLHIDASPERQDAFQKHFSHRFAVHAAHNVDNALYLYRKHEPIIVISHFQLNHGNGLQLCETLNTMNTPSVKIVHGAPTFGKLNSKRISSADVYVPQIMAPSLLEALTWNALVRRYTASSGRILTNKAAWKALVAEEPMLQKVRPLLRQIDEEDPIKLAEQLQALLHTRHTPRAVQTPFIAFAEPDQERRKELQAHFSNRLRLLFVSHPADLPSVVRRQTVAAIVVHDPSCTPELIQSIRGAQENHIPILAYGLPTALPVDRQLPQQLYPALLEVLLWEELSRTNPAAIHGSAESNATFEVKTANRSDTEVAARSSWGDLLQAEANTTNLKRLLIKEVSVPAQPAQQSPESTAPTPEEPPVHERSWYELLQSDVSSDTLKELLTREINLFPQR